MKLLPDKLHQLLRLSLDELDKCEVDCVIDMNYWYKNIDGVCKVCLAGAVIRGYLGYRHDGLCAPSRYDDDTANKLRAIDFLRMGCVYTALTCLQSRDMVYLDRRIPKYGEPTWREAMEKLYGDLKERDI